MSDKELAFLKRFIDIVHKKGYEKGLKDRKKKIMPTAMEKGVFLRKNPVDEFECLWCGGVYKTVSNNKITQWFCLPDRRYKT